MTDAVMTKWKRGLRWPFVSLRAYIHVCEQCDYLRHKAEQWEQRYLDATAPKTLPVVEKAVDPVARAIRDASAGNSALRGHLAHFARTERDKGTPDEQIVEQIRAYEQGPSRAVEKAERHDANAALAEILDAP